MTKPKYLKYIYRSQYILPLLLLLIIPTNLSAAITPKQIMDKAAATISGNIKVSYKATQRGTTINGSLISSGQRFYLDAGAAKIWYDGKTMTTLNRNTAEATITRPSAAEVNESNPMSYISGWQKNYNVKLATKQKSGTYTLVLTARNSSAAAQKAVLSVNASNFKPIKIVINHRGGGTSSITITKIQKPTSVSTATFTYPASRYPKYKIIDLR